MRESEIQTASPRIRQWRPRPTPDAGVLESECRQIGDVVFVPIITRIDAGVAAGGQIFENQGRQAKPVNRRKLPDGVLVYLSCRR